MWRTEPPRMPKIRTRLESYVVRNTADIVDDLSDERREELAEVLHDLEGHSPRATEQAISTQSPRGQRTRKRYALPLRRYA